MTINNTNNNTFGDTEINSLLSVNKSFCEPGKTGVTGPVTTGPGKTGPGGKTIRLGGVGLAVVAGNISLTSPIKHSFFHDYLLQMHRRKSTILHQRNILPDEIKKSFQRFLFLGGTCFIYIAVSLVAWLNAEYKDNTEDDGSKCCGQVVDDRSKTHPPAGIGIQGGQGRYDA